MSYIDVHLINFRCWTDRTFRLQSGVNLVSGKSGAGKSTLCKAIHFVIFGGRKHTDIENWNHIGKGSMVSLHFVSEQLQYKIIRTRPPEVLKLYVMQGGQVMELDGQAAQGWINNIFGEEDKWIASSSISMKKPHFLIGASNSDKTSLLQHISLGDVSARNQPDTYLTAIKTSISNYSGYLTKLDDEIRIQNSIKINIINKNPNIGFYGNITKEDLEQLIKFNEEEKVRLEELRRLYSSIQSRRLIEKKISEIQIPPYTLEDLQKEIDRSSSIKALYEMYFKLNGFDKRVLTIDRKELDNNAFLYSKLVNAGWSKDQDLLNFIEKQKKLFEVYMKQKEIVDRNNQISEQNRRSIQLNDKMKSEYESKIRNYEYELQRNRKHQEKLRNLNLEIEQFKSEVEGITNSDDLSLSYLERVDQYIQLYERMLRYDTELLNFDVDVLDEKSNELISKNSYLYSTYLNAGLILDLDENNLDVVKAYIELQYQLHLKYQEQLNIISENRKIEESNQRKRQINDSEKSTYERKLSRYQSDLQQLDLYNSSKTLLHDELLKCDKVIPESESDDCSSHYIKLKLDELKMTLNELICPCCNHGLVFRNSKLEVGKIDCGEESKEKIRQDIKNLEDELRKRLNYEKRKYEYDSFISKTKVPNPEKPIEPEYLQYDELKVIDPNITKPSIKIFEVPTISYSKLNSLLKSKDKIYSYNSYLKIKEQLQAYDFEYSKELKDKYSKQLVIRRNLSYKEGEYESLKDIKYNEPVMPIEDKYFELVELIPVDSNITKPILDVFDVPSISYSDLKSLKYSIDLIKIYNSFNEMLEKLKNDSYIKNSPLSDDFIIKEEIKNQITRLSQVLADCEKCKKYLNDCTSNIKCLKDSMKNLPEDDPEIENKIQKSSELIKYNDDKIVAGYAILDINNVTSTITECEKKRNEVISYIGTLNELYTYIQELGTNIIDSKIGEINSNMAMILDDLFDDEINVELSSVKTLKNGDTRLQINFSVDYKGHHLKGIEGFSDGEEERLSIALLMVFSRMNTSPILIIDEVLAGMNEELRMKCIEIIELWATGKFVIHICHSIVQGTHSNIINI